MLPLPHSTVPISQLRSCARAQHRKAETPGGWDLQAISGADYHIAPAKGDEQTAQGGAPCPWCLAGWVLGAAGTEGCSRWDRGQDTGAPSPL